MPRSRRCRRLTCMFTNTLASGCFRRHRLKTGEFLTRGLKFSTASVKLEELFPPPGLAGCIGGEVVDDPTQPDVGIAAGVKLCEGKGEGVLNNVLSVLTGQSEPPCPPNQASTKKPIGGCNLLGTHSFRACREYGLLLGRPLGARLQAGPMSRNGRHVPRIEQESPLHRGVSGILKVTRWSGLTL